MTGDQWIALIVASLTFLGLFGSGFAWIIGQSNRLRLELTNDIESLRLALEKDLESAVQKEALDIGALRSEALTKIDSVDQRSAKQGVDLSSMIQSNFTGLQVQVNQVRDASATKTELNAVEMRLSGQIGELKTESRAESAKLGAKVDKLQEQMPGITAQLSTITTMLGKVADRLSKDTGVIV